MSVSQALAKRIIEIRKAHTSMLDAQKRLAEAKEIVIDTGKAGLCQSMVLSALEGATMNLAYSEVILHTLIHEEGF